MAISQVSRVYLTSPLGIYVQGWQVSFDSWSVRRRMFPCVSETQEPWDLDPLECALRGLQEELGLSVGADRLVPIGFKEETKASLSSGAIKTYQFSDFALTLSLSEAMNLPLVIEEKGSVTLCFWRKKR